MARRGKRGFLNRLLRLLLRLAWRRTRRGVKARAQRFGASWRQTTGPKVVRRASDEYGGKRKPGPIPLRTATATEPVPLREYPAFLATLGVQHVAFSCHPDDEIDTRVVDLSTAACNLMAAAQSAAAALYGSVAFSWTVFRIEPRNDAARLACPETLYPQTDIARME